MDNKPPLTSFYKSGAKPTAQSQSKPTSSSGGFFSNVKSAFTNRVDQASDAQTSSINREQSLFSGGLQTIGAGAGFIGDLGLEAVKAVTPQGVEDAVGSTLTAAANTQPVQDIAAKFSSWAQQHPEAAANLSSTIDIASLLPIGAVGAKTAAVAGKTAATAAGTAIEGLSDVGGATARVASASGKRLYSSSITPTVKEAERLLNYEASNPVVDRLKKTIKGEVIPNQPRTRADTALEYGIMGTQRAIGVQAKRASDGLYTNKIKTALDSSSDVMTKEELFAPIVDRINTTSEPSRKAALKNAFEALVEDYQGIDNLTLPEANKIKTELSEFVPEKIYRGQSVASEFRTLQADMATAIRRKTYDSLKDVNIKKDYLDYSNLVELEKIGVSAITEKNLKGGFGGFWSAMYDAATVPIKTVGGQVLYRVGNKLEFKGPKGIKNFGQYLRSKGYKVRR